jgi:Na+/H+ antiporter NhaD/arsenite permease-like protein
MVGSLEENGLFAKLGGLVVQMTDGNLLYTALAILWFSAIVSAFLDNIPLVISMIPIIEKINETFAINMGLDPQGAEALNSIAAPLFWALALGACLGGNGTLIGASANVVVAQIARRNNYDLSFMAFTRLGLPCMLVSVFISMIYLVLRYFTF